MSFEPDGYLLTADDGPQLWFVGTRMNVKAGGAQTGGAFTFIEWSAPAGFGEFITEAGRPAQGPGLPEPAEPDIALLAAAGQRHGHQILGSPPAPPSR